MKMRCGLWLGSVMLLALAGNGLGQTQEERFSINNEARDAKIVQMNGHEYVDVEDLARITNGFLCFQQDRVVLFLPAPENETTTHARPPAREERLSKDFMRAGIEAAASMREWSSTLAYLLRYGIPVGDAMVPYREKALEELSVASVAASTASDQNALQLLSNEFQNSSTWSDDLVKARNAAFAGEYAMNDHALSTDSLFQKVSQCGSFLGAMLASGRFEDNNACH